MTARKCIFYQLLWGVFVFNLILLWSPPTLSFRIWGIKRNHGVHLFAQFFSKHELFPNEKQSQSPQLEDKVKGQGLDILLCKASAEDVVVSENITDLAAILSNLVQETDRIQQLKYSKEEDAAASAECFVTEIELQRLWFEASQRTMGKPIDQYNVVDALLLVCNEDDDHIMGKAEELVISNLDKNTFVLPAVHSSENADLAVLDDPVEYFITEEELARLWMDRSRIPWGMPSKSFEVKAAILLLDDDEDHDDDEEYVNTEYVDILENDQNGFWNEFSAPEEAKKRAALKRLYVNIFLPKRHRPGWKKERLFLTPDVDTQQFMGDIMQGGSLMTKRIPANWDDGEDDEMSDIYRSTETMALTEQDESDYNLKPPIWERLRLPYTLDMFKPSERSRMGLPQKIKSSNAIIGTTTALPASDEDGIENWQTFDFSTMEHHVQSAHVGGSGVPSFPILTRDEDDSIEFFLQQMEEKIRTRKDKWVKGLDKEIPEPGRMWKLFRVNDDAVDEDEDEDDDDEYAEEHENAEEDHEEDEDDDDDKFRDENAYRKQMLRFLRIEEYNARQPPESVDLLTEMHEELSIYDKPEYARHVGFEEWSQYPDIKFDGADVWAEDIATALCMKKVMDLTDLYLTDHLAIRKLLDEKNYWDRSLQTIFLGRNLTQEPIPRSLTPDIDRGVPYSNDIIEMKGKKTLHAYSPPPEVEWANDTFSYNTDAITLNQIGASRDQFDWTPSPREERATWEVDQEIVKKIEPVLKMINHGAVLRSTKDNILIFEYGSGMRQLIGIRELLLSMAKKCYPETMDLRLQTPRLTGLPEKNEFVKPVPIKKSGKDKFEA